jgi:hypothetical protein
MIYFAVRLRKDARERDICRVKIHKICLINLKNLEI